MLQLDDAKRLFEMFVAEKCKSYSSEVDWVEDNKKQTNHRGF